MSHTTLAARQRLLGRHVNHDPRSLNYPAPVDGVTIRSRRWRHYGPVLDQGQVGSCTGNAMAQALNTKPLKRCFQRLTEADAVELYTLATQLDEFPGEYPAQDTGSSGLAVAKAAQRKGYITSYSHAFGIDHTLAALMGGPVLLGTNWHAGMFEPDSRGFIEPTGPVEGGHEHLLLGVDLRHEFVTGLNSWGPAWGDRGFYHMSIANLDRLLREDGDAAVPHR